MKPTQKDPKKLSIMQSSQPEIPIHKPNLTYNSMPDMYKAKDKLTNTKTAYVQLLGQYSLLTKTISKKNNNPTLWSWRGYLSQENFQEGLALKFSKKALEKILNQTKNTEKLTSTTHSSTGNTPSGT